MTWKLIWDAYTSLLRSVIYQVSVGIVVIVAEFSRVDRVLDSPQQ